MISVVIQCFDRRTYLEAAVLSVLNQTLKRNQFEVVVVKNFLDRDIDRHLKDWGIVTVYCPSESYGVAAARALAVARGEVIAFLDDDDLFSADKLEIVGDEFAADSRLSFLHNGSELVDHQGSLIPSVSTPFYTLPHLSESTRFRVEGKRSLFLTRQLWKAGVAFNTSSIVVRKNILQPYIKYLEELPLMFDVFLLACAQLSGRAILVDGRRLTRYRIHSANYSNARGVSLSNHLKHQFDFSSRQIAGYRTILRMVESTPGADPLSSCLRAAYLGRTVFRSVESDHSSKRELGYALHAFCTNRSVRFGVDDAQVVILGVTALVSRGLARSLYFCFKVLTTGA